MIPDSSEYESPVILTEEQIESTMQQLQALRDQLENAHISDINNYIPVVRLIDMLGLADRTVRDRIKRMRIPLVKMRMHTGAGRKREHILGDHIHKDDAERVIKAVYGRE